MSLDWSWIRQQFPDIGGLVGLHVLLALTPVVVALVLALPLGYLVHRAGPAGRGVLLVLGLLSSVPALALFVLLPVLVGRALNPIGIVGALTGYALAQLASSVAAGLASVSPRVRESASALGYGRFRRAIRIELPLAMPSIFTGLRAATVSTIALVTVSVLVGQRSLGSLFDLGFTQRVGTPIVVGLVLCVVLAGLADGLIVAVRRAALRWRTAARA